MDVRPKVRANSGNAKNGRMDNLLDLPVELLLQIFALLDGKSLGRLAQTSRRLRLLSRDEILWTVLLRTSFRVRCPSPRHATFGPSDNYDVARVSHNWSTGTFEARRVVSFRQKEIPRLRIAESSRQQRHRQQRQQLIFSSHGRVIEMRQRAKNARIETVFRGFDADVTDFAVGAERLIGVCRDGKLGAWPLNDVEGRFTREERSGAEGGGKRRGRKKTTSVATRFMNCVVPGAHDGDIHAVVARDDVCITGSRDSFVKIWNVKEGEAGSRNQNCASLASAITMEDRVWSLAFAPEGATFASGTAGINGVPSLRLWNVEDGRLLGALGDTTNAKNGAGILHLHFETPHLLVSAGYDTCLRIWDLRTRSLAHEFEDPHDNAIYCACTDDGSPVVATGTARHAVVNLWDRRRGRMPMRMIYANQCEKKMSTSSPVYSMAMDWDRLYAAHDLGISLLDFGTYRTPRQNVQGSYSYCHRDEAG